MSVTAIICLILLVLFFINVAENALPSTLFLLLVGYLAFCIYRDEVGLPGMNPGDFLQLLWNSIVNIFGLQ